MRPTSDAHESPLLSDAAYRLLDDPSSRRRLRDLNNQLLHPVSSWFVSPQDVAQFRAALLNQFGSYREFPIPSDWYDLDSLEHEKRYPDHPLLHSLDRVRAAGYFLNLARQHPQSFTEEIMGQLHRSLSDVNAAVRADVAFTLGILAYPEVGDWLTEAYRDEPGSQTVREALEWAWLRVEGAMPDGFLKERSPTLRGIHAMRIGGEEIVLVKDETGGLLLLNPESQARVPVSPLEANVFMTTHEQMVERFFFSEGGLEGVTPTSPLGAVARGLSHGLPMRENLVTLIDTTTLLNAVSLVKSGRARFGSAFPEALFDLGALVYSCVMYDYVVVADETTLVPPSLSEFILPQATHTRGTLDDQYMFSTRITNDSRDLLRELEKEWTNFLGTNIMLSDRHVDHPEASPGLWFDQPGDKDPIQCLGYDRDFRYLSLDASASIQTWRYFANEKIAETLGVAYNSTSLRYPVARVALRHRQQFRQYADELLRRLDDRTTGTDWNTSEPYLPRISLPNPLAVVLSRARDVEDVWHQVLDLREEFRAVRERVQKARIEGSSDNRVVDDMVREAARVRTMGHQLDGVVVSGAAIAGAAPGAATFAAVALKVASTIPFFRLGERTLDWLVRPEICVVRSFRQEVAQVSYRTTDIERIWGFTPDRRWFNRAVRLSDSDPLHSSALRIRS